MDKSINTIVNNMNYIANRPRVVKVGSHGLFGQKDNINIKKALYRMLYRAYCAL